MIAISMGMTKIYKCKLINISYHLKRPSKFEIQFRCSAQTRVLTTDLANVVMQVTVMYFVLLCAKWMVISRFVCRIQFCWYQQFVDCCYGCVKTTSQWLINISPIHRCLNDEMSGIAAHSWVLYTGSKGSWVMINCSCSFLSRMFSCIVWAANEGYIYI